MNHASPMDHLQALEAESIHIFREVAAQCDRPVLLYSVGKDSSVLLHLARKAFFPALVPFPLLHIDTGWKFREMIEFRDRIAAQGREQILVHTNREAAASGLSPFGAGSENYTFTMKTQALIQALDRFGFDAAIGGARRDEEKSRAKERVFSFRNAFHKWDARNQRPEPWRLFNARKAKGESVRVFPLSNWTELDIWQYILREQIDVVPLYFAAKRPVVERQGMLILADDGRLLLEPGEIPATRTVRFRTLGCYPLTAAIESEARTVAEIVEEVAAATFSERAGRIIDFDPSDSMEKKKQEGYF
jgi:sulfate adenylyltransferase subunit 2